jgi:hypothetical protein
VRGFLAASADLGTLDEILRESGYEPKGDGWRPQEFVSVDHLTMSMKQRQCRNPPGSLPEPDSGV